MRLKLEINARGSWRSLIEFDAEKASQVRALANHLLSLDGNPPKARLVDGTGKVVEYWIDSVGGWHKPGIVNKAGQWT